MLLTSLVIMFVGDHGVCRPTEFVSLPYVEFLKRKDLTPNLIQYIVHCIAMVNEQVPTLEVNKR